MATFKNVSGVDREVFVDGRGVFVAADDSFDVADEFAQTLCDQPLFAEITAKKSKQDAAAPTTEGNN